MKAPCAGFVWFRLFRRSRWHSWGSQRYEGGFRLQTCLHCREVSEW